MPDNATGRAQGPAQMLIHDRQDENHPHFSADDRQDPVQFELAEMPVLDPFPKMTYQEALDYLEAHDVPWYVVLALLTAVWGRSA
jgi:hypothetical protein